MMSCMAAYTCICRRLEDEQGKDIQDALLVLRQFKPLFEEAEEAMADPALQEICRNAAELHFKGILPLLTPPWKTIQREYMKKSGKTLSDYLCCAAYYNTKDLDRGFIDADAAGGK